MRAGKAKTGVPPTKEQIARLDEQVERLRAIGFEFSTETEEIIAPKAVCVV